MPDPLAKLRALRERRSHVRDLVRAKFQAKQVSKLVTNARFVRDGQGPEKEVLAYAAGHRPLKLHEVFTGLTLEEIFRAVGDLSKDCRFTVEHSGRMRLTRTLTLKPEATTKAA